MEAENVYAVQKMQDHIRENLMGPITLSALSRSCGYSPFYCIRIFKELMGKTPFEYIRMLRLSKAALRLRDGNVKVLETALDFMFDSHEGFTRAFSKEFGITPSAYSRRPSPIRLFMPSSILSYYLFVKRGETEMKEKNETATVFVQVIERPKRKLILKRGKSAGDYFEYCGEVGCDVWGILCSIKEALYEPVGAWLPGRLIPEGTSRYVQGVEVPDGYSGVVPEGFEMIDLEPCSMMVFQGPEYDDNDDSFCDAIMLIQEAIEKYKPSTYGYEWADDDFPRLQLEPQGWRGYIESRPLRKIV